MSIWQGRIDSDETTPALRWHQVIQAWDGKVNLNSSFALLGFVCDEGVRRNQGRTGAAKGPAALRTALANLAYFRRDTPYDAGDVLCEEDQLEMAQTTLAHRISQILQFNGNPIILGGGHEMAWGSFLGLAQFLEAQAFKRRIGIINLDAHFDLRNPQPQPSSGSPFRQIAHWCEEHQQPFHYMTIGINPSVNTQALFDFAKRNGVIWHLDVDCTLQRFAELKSSITSFLQEIDELYLTICLDHFPAYAAPAVSAPSAVGVDPAIAIKLIQTLKPLCEEHQVQWRLSDIAELNPNFDQDGRTAKLAARLVHELISSTNI